MENFIKEFKRIKHNPIYFLEKYYNAINENKLELTDEQKQNLFDAFKGIPLFNQNDGMSEYFDRIDSLKKQGLKDWEM